MRARILAMIAATLCLIVTPMIAAMPTATAVPMPYKVPAPLIIDDRTSIWYGSRKVWDLNFAISQWNTKTHAIIRRGKCPNFKLGGQNCFVVIDAYNVMSNTAGLTQQPKLGQPGRIVLLNSNRAAKWTTTVKNWVTVHEMGHALGLVKHASPKCQCIMQAIYDKRIPPVPQSNDIMRVNLIWRDGIY